MKLFTQKETKVAAQSVLDELLRKENVASVALKAKEAQLNQVESEYPVRIEAKRRELQEIEQRIRLANEKEVTGILILEERRKEAIKPINDELKILQNVQKDIDNERVQIATDRIQLQQMRKLLNARADELEISKRSLEKTQSDMLSMLEQRRKEAETAVETASVAMDILKKEEKRISLLRAENTGKHESLTEAEHIAKAAMAKADIQIARAEHEQEKTDEKRRMLAAAIKELKKRGLWYKTQSVMKTK